MAMEWLSRVWVFVLEKAKTPATQRFLVTYVGYASLYSVRKPFSVVKTDIQRELSLSTYWLGLPDTTFLSSYAVGQFCIPILAANWNLQPNNVLLFLYVGSGVCTIAFGFSSHALTFASLWLVNGLMNAAVFPLLVDTLSASILPSQRGRVLGAWTTSQQLGGFLATVFAAYVAHNFHWRAVFIFPGFFILIIGVILKISLGRTQEDPTAINNSSARRIVTNYAKVSPPPVSSNTTNNQLNEVELATIQRSTSIPSSQDSRMSSTSSLSTPSADPASPKSRLKSGKGNLLDILKDIIKADDVKAIAISYFFVKMVRYSMLFWLPYYLSTELGYTVDIAGYASVMFDIGGFCGGLMAGNIADSFARGRRLSVASLGCVGTAISLLLFVLAGHHHKVVALILIAIIGLFTACSDSLIGGSAPADACERAALPERYVASASGIVNGFGSIGSIFQSYLTAHISETFGWGALYASLSGAAILGSLSLIRPAVHESAYTKRTRSGYIDEANHITVSA